MANIIFPRGFVHKYPYSDFHELNLDWILETVQKMSITVEEFINEYGTPTAVEDSSEMKNPNKIYVYVGETNPQFIYGHWYFYDTETNLWSDGGKYGALDIDSSFNIESRNAVENKAITRKFELVDASIYGLTSQVSNLSRDYGRLCTSV